MKTRILLATILLFVHVLNAQSPSLTYKGGVKQWENSVQGVSLTQPVAFSPDGLNFYVGAYDGFTWYTADAVNNTAVLSGWLQDASGDGDGVDGDGSGGGGVSDGHGVIVSPDGKHVYLASGYQEHSVSLYDRNLLTGEPTYVSIIRDGDQGITNMKYPYGVAMDSNGDNLYVVCKDYDGNSVVWFDRNHTDGSLTFNARLLDGENGLDGLGNATHIAISPDNKNAYIVGFGDDAISTYDRDLINGDLTQTGVIFDGTGSVNNMMDPYWVVVSPDGKHVYVSSQADATITIFNRNLTTGALSYNSEYIDPTNLLTVRGINLTPNGLIMIASAGDKQNMLQRNPSTGALSLLSYVENNVNGVQNIGGSRYNSLSPSASMFVATAYGESAVAWFQLDQGALSIEGEKQTSSFICLSSGSGNYVLGYNNVSVLNANISYNITDMRGEVLLTNQQDHFTSANISLNEYSKGLYLLTVWEGNRSFRYKLLNY